MTPVFLLMVLIRGESRRTHGVIIFNQSFKQLGAEQNYILGK